MKRIILILSILLACGISQASVSPEILSATKYASQRTGIPEWLILSIAHVESGFNPYAVNVAGKSYQPKTKEEAYAIIRNAILAGKSFDVGVMQVNSFWFKKYNIPYHYGLDLQNSFVMGAEILREEILRNGNNWLSVGYYHSKNINNIYTYYQKIRTISKHYK
ncbi:lytic transglycosylase domain-containing protein [Seleniivibrio woodruffii]|uniref:lytic transglycosylase domain-containing protein n=1 Tax=Seleniivibrio woodruffii TaxID=1078050 RepID=UPI002409E06F|nr:lytic transglycosylase domain-containing protein [Seleniivibrio woodruffii]